jgi:hypothetical protein
MSGDSTVRTAAATPLTQARYIHARLNALALKRANQTHSRADMEEMTTLRRKLEKLYREIDAQKYRRPQ